VKQKEIRDFVPINTALRIRNFIQFTLKLEGYAPELFIDHETKEQLEKFKKD
jgi:hypothetical protein